MGDVLVSDTSVLINFLAAARMGLLTMYAERKNCQLLITEHVEGEITTQYPTQFERLRTALNTGMLAVVAVDRLEELATFAELAKNGRLGRGECSAIAVALHRGFTLAIDDRRARRDALTLSATLRVLNTQELVVDMIRADVLTVTEADELKEVWSSRHRFRLPFVSFADIVA